MKWVGDRLAVTEIAHDEGDLRVLGPNGFGQRLKLLEIFLVHPLFVAEFQVAQVVGSGMTVGGAAAAPRAGNRAVHVLEEVSHVLGRLIQVKRRDAQKARRLAQVQEIQDAPTVGGVRIPGAVVRRTTVSRSDHLLPAVIGVVNHGTAVAQNGDPLGDETLGDIAPDRQSLERPQAPGCRKA